MPNGEFEQQLAEWEKKAKEHWRLLGQNQQRLADLTKRLEERFKPPAKWDIPAQIAQVFAYPERIFFPWIMPERTAEAVVARAEYKEQATVITDELIRSGFYYRLYNEVPFVITSGQATTVDDILTKLYVPPGISSDELAEIQDTISGMIATITGRELLPEMAAEVEIPELPELVPPVPPPIPTTIQRITVEEILKALTAPRMPPPVMTDTEWIDLLKMEGYSDADLEQVNFMKAEGERIVDEWQENNNRLAAFREGLAEMPDYKVTDLLKEMVVQPGLAMMEMAGMYFEHVSMPLAGAAYKTFIPDIEAEYQRLRKTESTYDALRHAWENWDSNWFLKYMIMEALVDPLTYVGWGIATKIAKPVPYVGRLVGAAERGIQSVFEVPFDLIKMGWKAMPKTPGLRALRAQHQAGQFVTQYMEKWTNKSFNQITMKEWDDAMEASLKFLSKHSQSEELPALAAKEFLKHKPINEGVVMDWANRLGTTLRPEDITRATIEAVDNIFEDAFIRKLITHKEAGGKLLSILSVQSADDKALKLAQRLIEQRGNLITNAARQFSRVESPYKAMQALMRRNYRLHIAIEESAAYLSRMEAGRISVLLSDSSIRLQRVWANSIDRWVIRPFAEAYLTFGMYGPMNVLEDTIRSTLGGVRPSRRTVVDFQRKWAGISYDAELVYRDAISEMIGYFRARPAGELNNWILQLGGLAKGFGDRTYRILVEYPGHIGMQMRRNFVDRKATQILAEKGGESVIRLMRVGPQKLSGVDKGITKQVEKAMVDARLSANPDYIRGLKDEFTRKKVVRREVENIYMEHPDLPMEVRNYGLQQYDDGILMRSSDDIERIAGRESNDIVLDKFVRGAEHATQQFDQLADLLIQMEVRNPQEMARCIQAVNKMAEVYGATPRQIMAQATIRSRGLPLAQRRTAIDKSFDDIYLFMDRAGASIEKVMVRLRAQMAGAGVTPEYVTKSERLFDLMTTKREYVTEFRAQNMATRREVFAGATPADLKTGTFWDDFYAQMDNEYLIFDGRMGDLDGMISQAIEGLDIAGGVKPFARPAIKVTDRALAPQDIATLIGARGDDISRALLDVLTAQNSKPHFVGYVLGKVRPGDEGFTKEAIGAVYDQIAYGLRVKPEAMSWITGKQLELDAVRRDLHGLYNSKFLPDDEVMAIHRFIDGTADGVEELAFTKIPGRGRRPPTRVIKQEFKDYNTLRQEAMDEAHKWYYKEYVDYTNANAFDQIMKAIYPYWTYESQRWFWLPRSFVRHPVAFAQIGRWMNNTDYGYIHIPGTSADINPFRGTVFGTLTTRLTRRDYPEYYDALPFAGGFVEFNDFLSRYGFYPGAHIGIPLALLGGLEAQFGEVLPASYKTGLDAMIAMFPESKSMKFISERIFGDRFRSYLAIREIDKRGGDGTLIHSKMKEGKELTPEEQALWDDARREVAFYSAGFAQFGLFRMRSAEQYRMYEEAGKAIEEMTGYTPDQQRWLRMHGYRLWDMVGGMSPTHQEILQELDYYRWIGSVRPLLPGSEQLILDKIELGWNDVRNFTEDLAQRKLTLQREFFAGARSPDDYNDQLILLYTEQRNYIDKKIEEYPLMLLENRKEYYKKYNRPIPVLHPMRELLNLYFTIELKEMTDPETGEKVKDWDTFWARREAIEDAIPDDLKQEWQDYLARNSTRLEEIRREVYKTYFKPYNRVWESILLSYPEQEQKSIEEYLYLERTGQKLDRQAEIKAMVSEKTGRQLISSFRTDVSNARLALRYANPALDAWLFYWGRTTSFQTPEAKTVYEQIAKDTGRAI